MCRVRANDERLAGRAGSLAPAPAEPATLLQIDATAVLVVFSARGVRVEKEPFLRDARRALEGRGPGQASRRTSRIVPITSIAAA